MQNRWGRLLAAVSDGLSPRCPVQVSVTDEEVVKARDFALAEIIKLSDSYRDMKINKVMSAETARSVSASRRPQPLSTPCPCVGLRLHVC
jgi:hypothetical protein